MMADVFRTNGDARRIILPGSALAYGMADAIMKGIALLWSIWLLVGPYIEDVRYFLDKVGCRNRFRG